MPYAQATAFDVEGMRCGEGPRCGEAQPVTRWEAQPLHPPLQLAEAAELPADLRLQLGDLRISQLGAVHVSTQSSLTRGWEASTAAWTLTLPLRWIT
jgi:hypothetical protein